jgi:hypothetical protein
MAAQFGAVLLVKVKVAVPPETPVTTPPDVTVAIALLLLAQVPPEVGDKLVVLPAQIEVLPVILTVGVVPLTVTAADPEGVADPQLSEALEMV